MGRAAVLEAFAQAAKDSVADVPACFVDAGTEHGVAEDPELATLAIGGTTFREVLGNWFFGRPGPIKMVE